MAKFKVDVGAKEASMKERKAKVQNLIKAGFSRKRAEQAVNGADGRELRKLEEEMQRDAASRLKS